MQNPSSGIRAKDGLFVALLIVLSRYFSYVQWSKIAGFWGDSARWLFETCRAFRGDTPYRDIESTPALVIGEDQAHLGAKYGAGATNGS
jgi:hypothetical protein